MYKIPNVSDTTKIKLFIIFISNDNFTIIPENKGVYYPGTFMSLSLLPNTNQNIHNLHILVGGGGFNSYVQMHCCTANDIIGDMSLIHHILRCDRYFSILIVAYHNYVRPRQGFRASQNYFAIFLASKFRN